MTNQPWMKADCECVVERDEENTDLNDQSAYKVTINPKCQKHSQGLSHPTVDDTITTKGEIK